MGGNVPTLTPPGIGIGARGFATSTLPLKASVRPGREEVVFSAQLHWTRAERSGKIREEVRRRRIIGYFEENKMIERKRRERS